MKGLGRQGSDGSNGNERRNSQVSRAVEKPQHTRCLVIQCDSRKTRQTGGQRKGRQVQSKGARLERREYNGIVWRGVRMTGLAEKASRRVGRA